MKTKKSLQYDEWLQQKLAKQREEKYLQQKKEAQLAKLKRVEEEKRKKERQVRYQDWFERKTHIKKSKEGNNELKGLKKFYSNDLVSPESNFNAWLKKKTAEQKANEHKKLLERKLKEEQIESRKLAAQDAYEKWLQLKNLESKHQKLIEKQQQHIYEDEIKMSHRGFQSTRSEMSYSTMMKFRKKRASADKAASTNFISTKPLMEYDEELEPDNVNGSQTYRKSPKHQNSFRKHKKSIAIINKNYQKHGLYHPPKKRYSHLAKKNCKSPPLSA